jgi:hypothetical protein
VNRHVVGAAAALTIALTLCGCGLLAGGRAPRPSSSSSPTASTSASRVPTSTTVSTTAATGSPSATAIARARRTHELPTPAGPVHVTGGWRTPSGAVSAFASVYINWTAVTVGTRLRALARASLGQARAEMRTEAQEVGRDRELHAGAIANAGVVESVAVLAPRDGAQAGEPREYTVVTRERTSAARDGAYRGLVAEWHVSVATVTRLSDGLWVVSGWQPES